MPALKLRQEDIYSCRLYCYWKSWSFAL